MLVVERESGSSCKKNSPSWVVSCPIWQINSIPCLSANMKNYAARKHRMDHSFHPKSREYSLEVVNLLHTLTKAVGTVAGNSMLNN